MPAQCLFGHNLSKISVSRYPIETQSTKYLLGGRVGDELDTLGDVALEALVASLEELLLVLVGRTNGVVGLLCALRAKLDRDGEVVKASLLGDSITTGDTGKVDESGLNDASLALVSLEELLGEAEASVGHGEGGGSGTILGLDDLVTTELNTVGKSVELVLGNVDSRLGLAEEGNDGLAGVTANDGNDGLRGVLLASDALDEGLGTDDVEGGDTEELLGVELAGLLEDFGGNGDGAVHGVGDDEDKGLGAVLDNALDQALDDAGVDLEEVVTGHARLACVYMLSSCSEDTMMAVGLRGMPAGMTTMSAPVNAFLRPSSAGRKPSIWAMEEM